MVALDGTSRPRPPPDLKRHAGPATAGRQARGDARPASAHRAGDERLPCRMCSSRSGSAMPRILTRSFGNTEPRDSVCLSTNPSARELACTRTDQGHKVFIRVAGSPCGASECRRMGWRAPCSACTGAGGRQLAEQCGYSTAAVERAFRAWFWREPTARGRAALRSTGDGRAAPIGG